MLTNVTVKILVSPIMEDNKIELVNIVFCPLFRSGIMLDTQKENILGMVFSDQLVPTRGQEFRDRARSIQLQQRLGYII